LHYVRRAINHEYPPYHHFERHAIHDHEQSAYHYLERHDNDDHEQSAYHYLEYDCGYHNIHSDDEFGINHHNGGASLQYRDCAGEIVPRGRDR